MLTNVNSIIIAPLGIEIHSYFGSNLPDIAFQNMTQVNYRSGASPYTTSIDGTRISGRRRNTIV
jgi:hypothetical protein